MVNLSSFQWCSTVDYADVAAKALGISTTDLRYALASGKTLQSLATDKGVTLTTVSDALNAAATTDIDQAVKDGILTQTQADNLKKAMTAQATATGPRFGRGFVGFFAVDPHNPVKPVIVASGALSMTCPDLAKALQTGQSIAEVATAKNVPLQTVIDALTKAYQDALAKDVDQGLISKAQADGEKTRLVDRILIAIAMPGGAFADGRFGGGMMIGGGRPNMPGNGGPNRPNDQNGQGNQGNPPGTPPAAPAAPGSSS